MNASMRCAALITAALSVVALSACTSKPDLPSSFEVIGKTSSAAGDMFVVRDTGTGCEWIVTSRGLMPRNERSTDGTSIKQRCLTLGGEETPATMAQDTIPSMPTTVTPAPGAIPGATAQDQAAIQAEVQRRLATTPTPQAAPAIPPPRGARKAKPRDAAPAPAASPGEDGVESQMKK